MNLRLKAEAYARGYGRSRVDGYVGGYKAAQKELEARVKELEEEGTYQAYSKVCKERTNLRVRVKELETALRHVVAAETYPLSDQAAAALEGK